MLNRILDKSYFFFFFYPSIGAMYMWYIFHALFIVLMVLIYLFLCKKDMIIRVRLG